MHHKSKFPAPFTVVLYTLVLWPTVQGSFPALHWKKKPESTAAGRFRSSVIFPVTGNVYPDGHYHVTIHIGNPPKPFFLDIDTGSDLTWLQCDAPCTKCTPAPHSPYKPNKDLISCNDPQCASLHWPANLLCETPDEQCDYEVQYADRGSSMGVLVKDAFPLRFTNGGIFGPRLAFGCGYNQEVPESIDTPYTDGVLGLGTGKSSIVSQLRDLGFTANVVGHCFSAEGGGFLFFGDEFVPSSEIIWTPMSQNSLENHYNLGPAELLFNGQPIGVKGLSLIFDSGSTYTYFNSQAYESLLPLIKDNVKGNKLKDAVEDNTLPVCWKGSKPFDSISDIENFFKPLALSFTNHNSVLLQLEPLNYLIVTEQGNVCLGILNGTEVGLGDFNVIGDISLQNKVVVYDNEKRQIGWLPSNCNRLPNVDRDYGEDYIESHRTNIMGTSKEQDRKVEL